MTAFETYKSKHFENALIPISPKDANSIYSGKTLVMIRNKVWNERIKKVFFYETVPVKLITGGFIPGESVSGSVEEIWRTFGKFSSLTRSDYDKFINYKIVEMKAVPVVKAFTLNKKYSLSEIGLRMCPRLMQYLEFDFGVKIVNGFISIERENNETLF